MLSAKKIVKAESRETVQTPAGKAISGDKRRIPTKNQYHLSPPSRYYLVLMKNKTHRVYVYIKLVHFDLNCKTLLWFRFALYFVVFCRLFFFFFYPRNVYRHDDNLHNA